MLMMCCSVVLCFDDEYGFPRTLVTSQHSKLSHLIDNDVLNDAGGDCVLKHAVVAASMLEILIVERTACPLPADFVATAQYAVLVMLALLHDV